MALSVDLVKAMAAQETAEVVIILLTIEHASMTPTVIRVTSDAVDTYSYLGDAATGITFLDTDINTGTNVITVTSHGLVTNDVVYFYTGGTLPTGVSDVVWYYVEKLTDNTFKLKTQASVEFDFVDAGTGTHGVIKPNRYLRFPFTIVLPESGEGTIPKIQLTIDNVDRSIVTAIRSISTPATVKLHVVLASSPNTIELVLTDFILRDVSYDAFKVTGTLTVENYMTEPYPYGRFTPKRFPGLF